uniref:Uncharacterized protein LOC101501116 n=1 Tax=Cicer arietinum TaxID=3827 RepID=A0A1S2XG90_CICAR|nr:uncharacterized protein LOC101501116 [Cicer arietinum]
MRVFKNIQDENDIVVRNKARLVAQGYNQEKGIDFDETFSSIARLEAIHLLLAYACSTDFELLQIDVKSAFLNGYIDEEVYVKQAPDLEDFKNPSHVFKLKKTLYDLKQAPRTWYDRLSNFLCERVFEKDYSQLKINAPNPQIFPNSRKSPSSLISAMDARKRGSRTKHASSEQLQAYFQKGDLRQSSTAAHDEEAEETTSDDDHISNRMVINKFNSLQTFITGQFQSLGTSINIFQNFETILAQNHELMLNELNGLILKIDQLHDPKDDNL